uniref:Docking protein 2 n=1 Tax=Anser cygnoides TaxID=8845 RepID=A0A8B9DEJ4_ANSCY
MVTSAAQEAGARAEHVEETEAADRTSQRRRARRRAGRGARGEPPAPRRRGAGGAGWARGAREDAPGWRMEEAVVKQGALYLQLQQTFGKKWKKFWGVLYRESSCSTARLELFEGSAPPAADKLRRSEGGRRLVKLSDCVHVAEASGDAGCPKDTVPFLLETTDKRYLLAAESSETAGWVLRLCELAFPRSREEQAAGKDGQPGSLGADGEFSMEENSLYSSRDKAGLEKEFEVMVRATESSERCRLWGRFVLRAGEEALELRDLQTREILYSWPYRFLRRFGRDKVTFSFEAGRRCASGEGNFEFETRQGNEIFQGHEEPGGEPHGGGGGGGTAKCLYAQPCNSLHRAAPSGASKALEKGRRQDAPAKAAAESEYAVPFDTIAKSLMGRQLGGLLRGPEEAPDPLYDSIHEAGARPPLPRSSAAKPEHIYDEPEGLCAHTVYDEPEEVKGEAWRLQAAPEEPSGHEYPYNPQRDDYAVPKRAVPLRQPFVAQGKEWLGDTEYDNVVLKFAKKRNLQ